MTAQEVIQAFIDGKPDCFGEEYILNNGVLYYASRDWPMAVYNDGVVFINTTVRSMQSLAAPVLYWCGFKDVAYVQTSIEQIKHILKDKLSNPDSYKSVYKQLEETQDELRLLKEEVAKDATLDVSK